MVFIVLLQELKKIKLTLYQCIIHLDKGLDEMIRIIALEKIALLYPFRPLFTVTTNNFLKRSKFCIF